MSALLHVEQKTMKHSFFSSTVHIHRVGWHFGVRLLRIFVSYDLACVLQHQHKTFIIAIDVYCTSLALRRNHLSFQISNAGHAGVCGAHDYWFYHGADGGRAIPMGRFHPSGVHVSILHRRLWHVEHLHICIDRFVCTKSQAMVTGLSWRRLPKQ